VGHRHLRSVYAVHIGAAVSIHFQLMLETRCQSRNVLLCGHVGQGGGCQGVLQTTHIARTTVSVFSLQVVVYRDRVDACQRRIVLAMERKVSLLDVVQEAG